MSLPLRARRRRRRRRQRQRLSIVYHACSSSSQRKLICIVGWRMLGEQQRIVRLETWKHLGLIVRPRLLLLLLLLLL